MGKVKNQHYVPRFYLKRFSVNNNNIFVYDKIQKKSFRSSIKSVSSTKFFYDWKELDDIVGTQFIEEVFSVLEGEVSCDIRDLLDRVDGNEFIGFTYKDRTSLAEFIWYQMIRNQEGRIIGRQLVERMEKELRQKGASEELLKEYGLLSNDYNDKIDHLKFILSFDKMEDLIRSLCKRIWILMKNETNYNFFTSDNPVARRTHWEIHHLAYELYYPLTPKIGINILYRDTFKDLEGWDNRIMLIKDKDVVKHYNHLQIIQSTRQIYSIDSNFGFVEKILKDNPEVGEVNRPRFGKGFGS